MKLDFYKEEWEEILNSCDFTDDELQVINLLRKGWCLIDIAAEMYVSLSTINRRKRNIENKVIHFIATH